MTIAITGATGFLGLRLLPLLMERGHQVVVLAHAGTPPARDRIARHFRASGKRSEAANDLTILLTDLTKPRLGLPHWQFRALAPKLIEIWHLAALTDLTGPAERVRPVNVAGTRAVLELASGGSSMLHHVSTAFVAGRRRTGLIREADLDPSYGFENAYEESKHDAEMAVHEWARENGRPAVIYRPGVLITDQFAPPGGARHPVVTAAILASLGGRPPVPEGDGGARLPLRLVAEPDAHLNLIPVELAARLMVELADRIPSSGVCTAHITYPHDVGIGALVTIVEHRFPVRVEFVAETPAEPSPMETLIAERLRAFIPFGFQHRQYDRAELKRAGLDPWDAPPLDNAYLLAAVAHGLGTDR